MSRQAKNWFVVGASGSGKSVFAEKLIQAGQNRTIYDICVNTSRAHAQLYDHNYYLRETEQAKMTAHGLKRLIQDNRRIHFEVAPSDATQHFMDALGVALLELGEYETDKCVARLVVDEAQNFVAKNAMPKGCKRLEGEGRKFGVDVVKVTPVFGSTSDDTVDSAAYKQANRIAVFGMHEQNQAERVVRTWPAIPDPLTYRFPDPARGSPGDYAILDKLSGNGVFITYHPDSNTRTMARIGAWSRQ